MKENPATDVDRAAMETINKLKMDLKEVTLPDWPYSSLMPVLFAEGAASFEELALNNELGSLKVQVKDAWPNLFRQARFLSAVDFVQADRFRRKVACAACVIAFTFLLACSADSQVVNIWPGVAPGSEKWTQKERTADNTPIGAVVFNVVTPTLTAYLPERDRATGTGVIIAPGGAFVALAIDLEGNNVARWLQGKGIAAFVLKYRIMEKRQEGIPAGMNMDEAGKYGIADGIQALKVVRQHAAEWGVST